MKYSLNAYRIAALGGILTLSIATTAHAQAFIPGPADVGRIAPPEDLKQPAPSAPSIIPDTTDEHIAPEGAEKIVFELKEIRLEGVTAFTREELADIYEPYIGQNVSLDVVWLIAGQITKRYRNQRYFLSRAYVPAQEIEDGIVIIRVVEGHIGQIEWQEPIEDSTIIQKLTERLLRERPLKTDTLESYLLRINDLPGKSFRAVVQPIEGDEEGVVSLALAQMETKGQGQIRLDNHGSRFLGPHRLTAFYEDSFLPMQQTSLSISTSIGDELHYANATHIIPVSPKISLELLGNYIHAEPGYSLEQLEIKSDSKELGIGVIYQPIRQWLQNLRLGLHLMGKDTDSDILGTPLTRERSRAIRMHAAYDTAGYFNGYSFWNATVSQGVDILGSSDAGDTDLSRPEARPDFTKIELSYTRQQPISDNVLFIGRFASQLASDPLYSSEEFGFGGQRFGRAYDPSEITGDHGMAFSAELHYKGLPSLHNIRLTPFAFYDVGKVWNKDAGGNISASSAGVGVQAALPRGIAGTLTAAQPLTRKIDNPLYGMDDQAPRFMFDLSYSF